MGLGTSGGVPFACHCLTKPSSPNAFDHASCTTASKQLTCPSRIFLVWTRVDGVAAQSWRSFRLGASQRRGFPLKVVKTGTVNDAKGAVGVFADLIQEDQDPLLSVGIDAPLFWQACEIFLAKMLHRGARSGTAGLRLADDAADVCSAGPTPRDRHQAWGQASRSTNPAMSGQPVPAQKIAPGSRWRRIGALPATSVSRTAVG
jgi:hypothetical protein